MQDSLSKPNVANSTRVGRSLVYGSAINFVHSCVLIIAFPFLFLSAGCTYSPYADRRMQSDPEMAVAGFVGKASSRTIWKITFPDEPKKQPTNLDVNTFHLRHGDTIQFIPDLNATALTGSIYSPDPSKLEGQETTVYFESPTETLVLKGEQDKATVMHKTFYVVITPHSESHIPIQVMWVRRNYD